MVLNQSKTLFIFETANHIASLNKRNNKIFDVTHHQQDHKKFARSFPLQNYRLQKWKDALHLGALARAVWLFQYIYEFISLFAEHICIIYSETEKNDHSKVSMFSTLFWLGPTNQQHLICLKAMIIQNLEGRPVKVINSA